MGILGLLDLVIGLIFIYFLLSLMVTAIQEIRASIFKIRAKNLAIWIKDTFDQKEGKKSKNSETDGNGDKKTLGELITEHKLIAGLVRKGRIPSYIPSNHFVSALLEIISESKNGIKAYDIETLKDAVEDTQLLPDDFKQSILQSISEAQGELKRVRDNLENWFDNAMIRVAGTYKNKQQTWLIIFSFVVVIGVNADTISISKFLYTNKAERESIAIAASKVVNDERIIEYIEKLENNDTSETSDILPEIIQSDLKEIIKYNEQLTSYDLPIGWKSGEIENMELFSLAMLSKILGWIMTAFAVSLGAPFWFDLLNKLVNLRRSGNAPKSTLTDPVKTAIK